MTSSSGAWASESKEVRLSRRFAIRAARDTRSPRGLMKTYSAAQSRSAAATSAFRSASSYSRMDSRSSASALLVAGESCAVAAAGARRISVRNDSKQSRFRIMEPPCVLKAGCTLLVTTQNAEPPKNADAKRRKSQPDKNAEHALMATSLRGRFGGIRRHDRNPMMQSAGRKSRDEPP